MTWGERLLGLVATALVAGCGSTTLAPTGGTATFSGAVTGMAAVYAVGDYNAGNVAVSFGVTSNGTYPSLTFAAEIPGTSLQTGVYSSANTTEASTVVQAAATGNNAWTQSSVGSTQAGTFSLTISSTGGSTTSNGTTAWVTPHGSLTATLPPEPGSTATGTVNVSATF